MEDGVQLGVSSMLAMVYFCFVGLVNVHEVVGGFLTGIDTIDLAFLMPRLEDATDTIRVIAPLDEILHGLLLDH